ncbi:hypothetical protein [Shewanella inventionis]|nr:hypothetical protein [Shewanella inventionis]MCL1157816.1 hypothetical protein [Shewanella inventionis]
MNRNFVKSATIGVFMGLTLSFIDVRNTEYGLLIAFCICVVAGILSAQIDEYPRLYAVFTGVVSLPFFIFSNGVDEGFVYFAGAFFVYGILSFSITLGLQNSFHNGKVIWRYWFKK